jgi:transposase
VQVVERSKIVLFAAKGSTNKAIAEEMGTDVIKVARWRNRYAEAGHDGIAKNRPRGANQGGKSSRDQARLRSRIIRLTMESKPEGSTHWSTRSMAKELKTTHSFVNRVWNECGFKPHLLRQFKISNDPLFEEKLVDVVGLYLDPPENAVVLCVDEKSSIQALDRTQPGLPLKQGRGETMTHDYKRHGTSTLFAALNVSDGSIIGECKKRHRHQEFLAFLKKVERQTPEGQDLHIIVDNYATHKHQKIRNWLKRNIRVHLHFTPTSSSWLNLVERFFGDLSAQALSKASFKSIRELVQRMETYIAEHNLEPKRYVWKADGQEILAKIARAKEHLAAL